MVQLPLKLTSQHLLRESTPPLGVNIPANMTRENIFYLMKDNGFSLHDTFDAMIVYGAIKKLKKEEGIPEPILQDIVMKAGEGKWFSAGYSEKIEAVLDNLEEQGLIKKLDDDISYALL